MQIKRCLSMIERTSRLFNVNNHRFSLRYKTDFLLSVIQWETTRANANTKTPKTADRHNGTCRKHFRILKVLKIQPPRIFWNHLWKNQPAIQTRPVLLTRNNTEVRISIASSGIAANFFHYLQPFFTALNTPTKKNKKNLHSLIEKHFPSLF